MFCLHVYICTMCLLMDAVRHNVGDGNQIRVICRKSVLLSPVPSPQPQIYNLIMKTMNTACAI